MTAASQLQLTLRVALSPLELLDWKIEARPMFPLLRKTNQATFSIFAYAMSGADTSCLGLRNSYDPFYQLCTLWGKINLTGVFSYLKVAGRVPCCAAANSLRALRVTRLRYSHACTTSLAACLCCFYLFLS